MDWEQFDRLLAQYNERFEDGLPTEQMPQADFANAVEIMRECLRTGDPYIAATVSDFLCF